MSETIVTQYLDSKKIDYRLDGENAIFNCPFCNDTESKFGINTSNWLGQCFKGSCATKVNEITFKRHYGDSAWVSNLEDEIAQVPVAAKKSEPEPLPDVDAAHQKLLESDEILNWLNDERGWSLETIKASKLGLGLRRFGPKGTPASQALMFPYFEQRKCVGVKYRSLPPEEKDFRFTAGREPGLYGQDVIKAGMEYLCLLEGESDSNSLWNQGEPNAVGVPGCDGKKVTWDEQLLKPKKKYLVFDNDEAGQKGALGFATRFGLDEFYNVVIPKYELDSPVVDKHGVERTTVKDVSDFFTSGHTLEEFHKLLEEAKPFEMEGIVSMQTAFDEIIADFEERGNLDRKYKFLWPSVNTKAKGIDDGDLIAIIAQRKVGKTTFVLNQLEHMLSTYGINIHFECLEMSPKQLTRKWAAMYMGLNEDDMTIEQFKAAKAADHARPNHFYFSQSSPKTEDEMMQTMRKVARRYAIGAAAFDNLQLLVDTTITRADRSNRPAFISSITKKFKKLAGELRYPLFLICQPKNVADGEMVSGNDSEGSGAVANDSDLVMTLNRAREAKMKMDAMASLGNFETNQSHSDTMYVETAYSRRSEGGYVTLKIDGAKSLIREFNSDETTSGQKKAMINGIVFSDDNAAVAI